MYEKLKSIAGRLPVRVVMTWRPGASRPVEEIEREIRESKWTSNYGDNWLKFATYKVTLDGGQTVGTAYSGCRMVRSGGNCTGRRIRMRAAR